MQETMSGQAHSTDHTQDAIEEAIRSATRGAGKVNILIAGKTGVGKSTLINSVFRGDLAETGSGRPVTQHTEEITKKGHPLTILDTKGLELADYEKINSTLRSLVEERSNDWDENNHIHAAWVCIHEDGRRIEEAEIQLCQMLSDQKIPVIVVITKVRNDDGFSAEVKKALPMATSVVRVRAIEEVLDDEDVKLPVKGLDDLISATANVIPEAQKRAYANALSSKHKRALKIKIEQAELEVNVAAGLAAAAAAVPVPFSDAFTLVPIQIGMLAKVGITFGMEVSATALTTMVTSLLGASAATVIGRTLVSGALKLIPGIGSAVGGTIAASTAAALTKALGNAYISVLRDFCLENPGAELDIANITATLKKRLSF